MSYGIVVVVEGPGDFELASRLLDRVIFAVGPDWVRDDLDMARSYVGIHSELQESLEKYVRWEHLPKIIQKRSNTATVRVTGFGDDLKQLSLEAFRFAKFVTVIRSNIDFELVSAFLWLKDSDGDDDLRKNLLAINDIDPKKAHYAVGVPHPETECWELAGFEHDITDVEKDRLKEISREVNFNPCHHSHRLNAASEGDARHPKPILRRLTNTNEDRVRQCHKAPFELLKRNGEENGIKVFLELLENSFVPRLFQGDAERPKS